MRVVVIGATGNVVTSVLRALALDPDVTLIKGVARRLPRANFAKTEFHAADLSRDDFTPLFRGTDCATQVSRP